MTQTEQQKNAKAFAENWKDKGDEKQETSRFWIGILGEVLGIINPQNYIEFEKKVKRVESRHCERSEAISESEKDCHTDSELLRNSNAKNRNETKSTSSSHYSTTNFIDAYIPETKVLIEQKGIKIDLNKAYEQSDGTMLTPYEQAKRYADEMPYDIRPRWIVVSNFAEIHIHDMNKPNEQPQIVFLKDLEKDFYRLEFLVNRKNENIRREEEISIAAGKLVGKMYDALVKEYINPTAESYRSLNVLCVRLVFCFYAEDAGLFETRTSFEDYIKSFAVENVRDGIIKLFKALDTKLENRDKYDLKLKPFPYVNGGLFHDENIEIPNFTQEIVDVLVNDCAPFDWHEISPTIFGAVFESTLNPETRRKGGMHYTSIENIHKVIDSLFLDDLNEEFNEIMGNSRHAEQSITLSGEQESLSGLTRQSKNKKIAVSSTAMTGKQRSAALLAFQEKLGSLTFLDPACGSGNFLTETYLSLRRLENKVISALNKGERVLGFDEFIKVKISQFYGIEINDFAVTVAKTALWIAESQMINETEKIISQQIEFLPLKTQANIVEGNALRMNWATLTNEDGTKTEQPMLFDLDKQENAVVEPVETTSNGKGHFDRLNDLTNHYDYIMGNPPFVGYSLQSESQKNDMLSIFVDENGKSYKTAGKIDYVSGWYFKAAELIKNTKTKCAFVSTNSITQGEQVASIWKPLFERFNIKFDFAYRSFKWNSESTEKAQVYCVIIGFSCANQKDCHTDSELLRNSSDNKFIISEQGERIIVQNINPYLIDAPNAWIESRNKSLCDVPQMTTGNRPADGGHLIIEENEYDDFIKKEPEAKKFIKKLTGAEEYINGKKRYCLWLVGVSPAQIKKMPLVYKRVQLCREDRLNGASDRQKLADTPALFRETKNPKQYLIVPRVSSENRKYIPIGFLDENTIPTDSATIIIDAGLYDFGVLTSSVHMAWMRTVCGRLKSDYRYSKDIVYNNFPWPCARSAQVSGARNQGLGMKAAQSKAGGENDKKLQGIDCLAEIDGRNAGNLSACKEAAERGDLRALRPDEAGGSLDSVKHCGRTRQNISEGIRAVSVDSERLGLRAGNSASSLCEDKISDGNGYSAGDEPAFRNRKNDNRNNFETSNLTPDAYALNPKNYSLITRTAQAILDARSKYPDSSLADLYDETLMPPDLRKAHEANDRTVMQAYGFDKNASESEIVAELFKMYANARECKRQ